MDCFKSTSTKGTFAEWILYTQSFISCMSGQNDQFGKKPAHLWRRAELPLYRSCSTTALVPSVPHGSRNLERESLIHWPIFNSYKDTEAYQLRIHLSRRLYSGNKTQS